MDKTAKVMCSYFNEHKKEEMTRHSEKASYLRLLGMTSMGREYLNKKKSHLGLPLISKLASFKEKEINLDIKAARIYSLGIPSHLKNKMLRQEFEQPPIYIQEK
nr:nucleotidyltransferase family protein [Bacillus sp. OV166]